MNPADPISPVVGALERAYDAVRAGRERFTPELSAREVGVVKTVSAGIATVAGLPGVGFEEVVRFESGLLGMAFDLGKTEVGVILLGEASRLRAGDEVERTGRVADVPVGDALIGRVINPLGEPLDGGQPVAFEGRMPIESDAPHIMDRAPVSVPLETGIAAIDALIPIGRGQRELILGDRQTGKTAVAVNAILSQRDGDVVCIYCAIGQRASAVAKIVAELSSRGALGRTIVMATEGSDAPGLSYIAPYAATSIAEHFMRRGRDVLIVYDDLTNHARSYRELSLLMRRPPGREAFPGDIFYIHSRLLERATRLLPELGGGSITALPIVETEAQDMAAYIPTNLISITDGQIYLSPALFSLGVLPAIDIAKSVSRVGAKAQYGAYREVAGSLKLGYSQFEELEAFARFGTRLDDHTRSVIERGRRIRESLKQPEYAPISLGSQLAVLLAVTDGLFDTVPSARVAVAVRAVRDSAKGLAPGLAERLRLATGLAPEDRALLLDAATAALAPFRQQP